ncbi:M13-type metalloendopeptidase [Lactiplantibacillus sp. WILCCON 0030]|uniref:M13-type metalloendopeptidase n=1 Tax=Lactiplantibacillus brownii TaxID=3069269 RepID=A0ABU1AD97_9LACO|nr:M13-type metalloendopeptidase [Lactiplantibacillus brownii]MDQ7938610.1 M13-type metalloendopeptidase [Lactiplantibacillus brownii]
MATISQAAVKQDLYDAVNGDWLKTAEIPDDHASTGGFMDLVDAIEKTLMHDFDAMAAGETAPNDPQLAEFIKFYQLTKDFKQRNAAGANPILPCLKQIDSLSDFADLQQRMPDWLYDGLPLPFSLDVDADMKNTKVNALFAQAPNTILPDKTYYDDGNESGPKLLAVYGQMMTQLLQLTGYKEVEAQQIVADTLKFDRLIVPWVKSAEEAADYSKMYNPRAFKDFANDSKYLDLAAITYSVINGNPETVILPEPAFFDHFNEVVNPENFEMMKNWMKAKLVQRLSGYLSDEMRTLGTTYSRTLSGQKQPRNQAKSAYYLAAGAFDQVVGLYYGHTYFGEAAKADVHQMVEKMIGVYKRRLEANTWLSADTRAKAVTKLNNLGIQVGYPDKLEAVYTKFHTLSAADGGSVLSNVLAFGRIARKDMFAKWGQPTDRTRWEMSADTVNAYYHPFMNIIVFPAAILQAPFYSLAQSSSANYGGIGAVIAHEISHAFDNNGALFDEFGNLHNWWTEADSAHFKELAKAMITEFDGLEFAGAKVNGTLTVSENIADAGGLSCAEEAAKNEADVDLSAFFTNWAMVWRMKATKQYMQLLLSIDVHAPAKLRANVQPKNLDDFYTTFDITPEDPMYLAPDQRVKIW